MSTRRSRPSKKSRAAEAAAPLTDVLDASAPAPMLAPPPPVASGDVVLSTADELALVDAAWDELLA